MTDLDKVALLESMCEFLKETPFSLDGPMMVCVVLQDGTFRNKNVLGMDFFPSKFRIGARDILFCFEPEDPQDFASIELPAKKIDHAFPLFLEWLESWARKEFPAMSSTLNFASVFDLLNWVWNEFDIRKATIDEEDVNEMKSNPMFGMF